MTTSNAVSSTRVPVALRTRILRMNDGEWILRQAEEDLRSMTPETFTTTLLEKNLVGFNHPTFASIRKRETEQDEYLQNPYEVEEGVITCLRCKSNRVFSTTIQTRASDEPMTTLAVCANCKNKWTQNG